MNRRILLFFSFILIILFNQLSYAKTPSNIYKEQVESMLYIETNNSTGSGVFIKPDGTFVTCFHVVADADFVNIKTVDGAKYKAYGIKYLNPQKDIAVLTINTKKTVKPIKINSSKVLNVGDAVYAISNPNGIKFVFTDGMINQLSKDDIQFSAPASPGSSGGALLNSNGELIGIISSQYNPSKSQNINFAIPVSVFEKYIDAKAKNNSKKLPWSDFMISKSTAAQKKAYMEYAKKRRDLGLVYKCSKPKSEKEIKSPNDYAYWGTFALYGYIYTGLCNDSLVDDAITWFNKSKQSNENMELSIYSLVLCSYFSKDKKTFDENINLLHKYPRSYRVITRARKMLASDNGKTDSKKIVSEMLNHLYSLSKHLKATSEI